MTILHAGEIGRLDTTTAISGTDLFLLYRDGGLFAPSAEILRNYFGEGGTSIARVSASTIINADFAQWNGNTDSGNIVLTLPAGMQNTQFKLVNTGQSNNILTITPDGSENLLGLNESFDLSDGESLVIAYDTMDGWY